MQIRLAAAYIRNQDKSHLPDRDTRNQACTVLARSIESFVLSIALTRLLDLLLI